MFLGQLRLDDVEQFYFEDQYFVGADLSATTSTLAVGHVRRDVQHPFVADLHLLQCRLPTLNDLVDFEFGGFAASDAAIEFGSIGQLAGVVNLHGIRRRW